MSLMNIPLPAVLPECEQPSSFEYFERRGTVFITHPAVFSHWLFHF